MKKILIILLSVVIIVAIGAYFYVNSVISTGFDIKQPAYIEIDNNKNYDSIKAWFNDSAHIQSIKNFELVANYLDYPDQIKTGRYKITPDMTVLQAVRLLKSGSQTPVRLTFNNIRLKDDLVIRLSNQLMLSPDQLNAALNDSALCEKYGFKKQNIVAMFIPNTYEVYWNTSLDKFLDKMHNEYVRFWNTDRKEKATKLGLTPLEVSALASIVEEECYFSDEYPLVAGLYLNRLKKGMKLQADPTVKFAVGDFTLRRVLNKHLEVDSPYNTYQYEGLPPGPIRVPSIKAIDGVLNHQNNDYLFMCAKEDFSGRHNFAKTHDEHIRNRQRYTTALNQRNIYK